MILNFMPWNDYYRKSNNALSKVYLYFHNNYFYKSNIFTILESSRMSASSWIAWVRACAPMQTASLNFGRVVVDNVRNKIVEINTAARLGVKKAEIQWAAGSKARYKIYRCRRMHNNDDFADCLKSIAKTITENEKGLKWFLKEFRVNEYHIVGRCRHT